MVVVVVVVVVSVVTRLDERIERLLSTLSRSNSQNWTFNYVLNQRVDKPSLEIDGFSNLVQSVA